MVNKVPVTISDGVNSNTIYDDFSVVPTEYDNNGKELSLFILGTQWQYRAGWEPLVNGEFKTTCNGKLLKSLYLYIRHTVIFLLWDVLHVIPIQKKSTHKERISELERLLYITLKSKAELNDLCEQLLSRNWGP